MQYVKGIILIGIAVVMLASWGLGFVVEPSFVVPPDEIVWGTTFSMKWADSFDGVAWKEAYTAMLDDLKIRHVRLPVYWDEVEREQGVYDFTDLDWQVEQAQQRGVNLILTIGHRVPRWPECHVPDWAAAMSYQQQHERLLPFMERVVRRYRDVEAVRWWQVENEPFLPKFGECPPIVPEHLDEEIELVRSLDDRPILVSSSGELSLWVPAASRADVFGTTMYKVIWNRLFGQVWYPIIPEFFHAKANLVRLVVDPDPDRFVVIELQAEPWQHKQTWEVGPEEHYDSMHFNQFRENIRFAEEVGFPEVYFWGVEWWYWMKEAAGDDRFWNYAKAKIAGE